MIKKVKVGHFVTNFSHISFRAFVYKGEGFKVSVLRCRDFDSGEDVEFFFGKRVDRMITSKLKEIAVQFDTKKIGNFELIVERTGQGSSTDYKVKIKPLPVQKAFPPVFIQWGDMGKRLLDLK